MTRTETPSGFILSPDRLTDQSGSVLATVLVVLIILLSIFLSAMTYALSRYSRHMARQNSLIASHLSDAGIAHIVALLEQDGFHPGRQSWLAPNGGEITTDLSAWGPYILVRSTGETGNQRVTANALVGSSRLGFQQAAVTVGDESNPLVIAGHTRIVGDINVGPEGMMEGQFRGEGVTHPDYHIGQLRQYQALEIPKLDTTVFNLYKRELRVRSRQPSARLSGTVVLGPGDEGFLERDSSLRIENNLVLRDVTLHLSDNIKTITVDGSVEITGRTHLSGLIEIVAENAIFVRDSAVVDNVILTATDSVIVTGAARSSAILISEGSVVITDRASLVYPSLLLADISEGPNRQGGLFLRSRVPMESTVWLTEKPFQMPSPDRLLYVDTVSLVRGNLVSQGYTDLRGRLEGSCLTERFHFDYPPTTYVNWLKDAYLDRTRLDYTPVLPALADLDSTAGYYVMRQERVQ